MKSLARRHDDASKFMYYIAQPTISKAIKDIEMKWARPYLIEEKTFRLTDAGQIFYESKVFVALLLFTIKRKLNGLEQGI